MSDMFKRVPWVQLMWPLVIAVIFYAYTANVKATIREELRNYVTQIEYETYKESHKEYVNEVRFSLDKRLDAIDLQGRENNRLLMQLLDKQAMQSK